MGRGRPSPLYPGTAEERMTEIGNDLVRLGVCEKRGPRTFGFSAMFLAQLVAFGEIIRSAMANPDGDPERAELKRRLFALPYFEDSFKVPLLSCHMVLKDAFKLDRVDDVLFSEYMAFCFEVMRGIRFQDSEAFNPH